MAGAGAEAVAPVDDNVGIVNGGAGLNGAVVNAVAEANIIANAGEVGRLAVELQSLGEHVGAADALSPIMSVA
jgi:hypothetical protein